MPQLVFISWMLSCFEFLQDQLVMDIINLDFVCVFVKKCLKVFVRGWNSSVEIVTNLAKITIVDKAKIVDKVIGY